MKKLGLLLFAVMLFSCQDNGKQIAKEINGVVTVELSDLGDTLDVPLSDIIKDIKIMQLDSAIVSYVNRAFVISDNYMVLADNKCRLKLFDRATGKYLCNVGSIGNGHGEYIYVNKVEINEAKREIYVVKVMAKNINVYNFEGSYTGEIPLACEVGTNFNLSLNDAKTVFTITTKVGKEDVIWQQDLEGKIVTEPKRYETGQGTNLAMTNSNDELSVHFKNHSNKPDTLFRYNAKNSSLDPIFIMNLSGVRELDAQSQEEPIVINYDETPKYYFVGLFSTKSVDVNGKSFKVLDSKANVMVDKKALTGGNIKMIVDHLGNLDLKYFQFNNGYFSQCFDPISLLGRLNAISDEERSKMDSETLARIDNLIETIDEEGNSVLIFGKLQ